MKITLTFSFRGPHNSWRFSSSISVEGELIIPLLLVREKGKSRWTYPVRGTDWADCHGKKKYYIELKRVKGNCLDNLDIYVMWFKYSLVKFVENINCALNSLRSYFVDEGLKRKKCVLWGKYYTELQNIESNCLDSLDTDVVVQI